MLSCVAGSSSCELAAALGAASPTASAPAATMGWLAFPTALWPFGHALECWPTARMPGCNARQHRGHSPLGVFTYGRLIAGGGSGGGDFSTATWLAPMLGPSSIGVSGASGRGFLRGASIATSPRVGSFSAVASISSPDADVSSEVRRLRSVPPGPATASCPLSRRRMHLSTHARCIFASASWLSKCAMLESASPSSFSQSTS